MAATIQLERSDDRLGEKLHKPDLLILDSVEVHQRFFWCEQRNIDFFDITPISREALNNPVYVAVDGLHPSGEMYAEWVKMVIPFFNQ